MKKFFKHVAPELHDQTVTMNRIDQTVTQNNTNKSEGETTMTKNIKGIENVRAALQEQNKAPNTPIMTVSKQHIIHGEDGVGQIVGRAMTDEEMAKAEKARAHHAEAMAKGEENKTIRANGRIARRLEKEKRQEEERAREAARAERDSLKNLLKNEAQAVIAKGEEYAAKDAERKLKIEQHLREVAAEEEILQDVEPARPVQKRDKAEIAGFRHLTIPAVAFFPEVMKLIEEINNIKVDSDIAVHTMRQKITALHKLAADAALANEPLAVNKGLCHLDSGRQSEATDIAGVVYGEFTNLLVKTDAPFYNMLKPNQKVMMSAFKNYETLVDEITNALRLALTCRGVKVDDKVYVEWGASASMQKEGKCWFGETKMMDHTADARYLLQFMDDESDGEKDYVTNGADELKRQATYFSPSSILYDNDGNPVYIRDIGIVKDIVTTEKVENALVIYDNGKYERVADYQVKVTKADGAVYLIGIDSHQGRCTMCKYNAVDVSTVMPCVKVPEYLECLDGIRETAKLRGFATESICKYKGLGINHAQFLNLVDKLAVKYPGFNCLRAMRYANQSEEKPRHTSRQLSQQFLTATDDQLYRWMKPIARNLLRNTTVSGQIMRLAGLDKPEEERTVMQKLFGLCPSLAISKQFEYILIEEMEQYFANVCSGNTNVVGMYPYITEDPLAVLQVILEGRDPKDQNLGVLNPGEVNLPGVGHGRKCMSVRYPANFLTADVYVNVTDGCGIFYSVGNVAILPFHGLYLIVNDGDVDGDEALFLFNQVIIEIVEKLHKDIDIPVIVFDHNSSNEKHVVRTMADLHKMVAKSLFIAEKYSRVGIYSNLAARCMTLAGDAAYRGDKDALDHWMINSAFANVGTILCIDMVKTGKVPTELIAKLDEIAKECSSKMPHNQRYAKHNSEKPYWSCEWDNSTMPMTKAVVDRIHDVLADFLKDYVDEESGEVMFRIDHEGLEFDINDLLCHNPRVFRGYAPAGILSKETVDKIGLFNWTAKEYKIELEDGKFSPKEIMKYFWENEAAIKYRSFNDEMSGLEADEQRTLLREYCRSVLLEIYRTEPCDFNNLPDDLKVKSISNWFVRDAFNMLLNANGTRKARKEALAYEDRHREASYARFVVEVFAEDILDNVKTNLLNPEKEQQMVRNVVMVQLDETGMNKTLYTYITEERMYNGQMVVCPTPKGDKVCEVIHSGTRTVEALEAYRQQQHFDAYKVARPYAG